MTPAQRAATERLAAALDDLHSPFDIEATVTLLRELAAEPVQEPAIWIQSNHLQHAKNGPYLARTGPTKLMSDFIPLYAAPQQRKPQGEPVAWMYEHDGMIYGDSNQPIITTARWPSPVKEPYTETPLYAAPQQPMHCPKDGGECGAGGYCRPEPKQRSRALADAGFTRRPSLKAIEMRAALELIATPQRPDGTWNRDREACRELAAEALGRYDDSKTPNASLSGGQRPSA